MEKRLRFPDLKNGGIVNNRVTPANWIRDHGFPPGQLTGPNSRTWGEDEVRAWIDGRPTGKKPTPRSRGRPPKNAATMRTDRATNQTRVRRSRAS